MNVMIYAHSVFGQRNLIPFYLERDRKTHTVRRKDAYGFQTHRCCLHPDSHTEK